MRDVASSAGCMLNIVCPTKREALVIAATAMWMASGLRGVHERAWALTREGEGWRVAVALHETSDVERFEYDDADSLIDYLSQE